MNITLIIAIVILSAISLFVLSGIGYGLYHAVIRGTYRICEYCNYKSPDKDAKDIHKITWISSKTHEREFHTICNKCYDKIVKPTEFEKVLDDYRRAVVNPQYTWDDEAAAKKRVLDVFNKTAKVI